MQPITRETYPDRRQPQIRWGAVLAGTALTVGLWIFLQTLGMGLGLTSVDTDNAGSLKNAGIGTGIWSLIAPLIAMFIGAFLVGRLAGTRDPKVGGMHGSVMWALATLIGLWAMMSVVSSMASGIARVGSAAAGATSSVVSSAVSAGGGAGDAMSALGIDSKDLVAPINERLQRQGKPQVTPEQLNATMRAVAQRGVRQGKLDRAVLVEELAKNTALSQQDAQEIATQFGDKYQDVATKAGARVEELGEDAKEAGLAAADKTGKALLLGALMMFLSLAAAVGGGLLGVRSLLRSRDGGGGGNTATTVPPVTYSNES